MHVWILHVETDCLLWYDVRTPSYSSLQSWSQAYEFLMKNFSDEEISLLRFQSAPSSLTWMAQNLDMRIWEFSQVYEVYNKSHYVLFTFWSCVFDDYWTDPLMIGVWKYRDLPDEASAECLFGDIPDNYLQLYC